MVSAKGRIAGVMGWPVSHSLSPRVHQYWLNFYGLDGAYIPLPVRSEDLKFVVSTMPKMGFRGVNITLPHKEAIVPLMHNLDEVARAIGAVNTVIIGEDCKLFGTNTDVAGFMENIRESLPSTKNKAVVLGAGGAAKAVCYALLQAGFNTVVVVNRTREHAQALAEKFGQRIIVEDWQVRSECLAGADMLVNTTNLGMTGKEPLMIYLEALPRHAMVTDIVYAPLMTDLLLRAKSRGHVVVDGLGMLLHQAAPGFEAWFGVKPEVTDELRRFVLHV